MTRVVVSSKQNLNILQDGQIKSVVLNQASIIQVSVNQQDIKSIVKQGNDLIITLKNGEKIVVNDFFNDVNISEHTLALQQTDGTYAVAQFDDAGKFMRYSPATQLSQFAYTEAPTQVAITQNDNSDVGISKAQLIKVGLVALAAEGVYLWAVKDDDKDDQPKEVDRTAPVIKATLSTDDSQTITVKSEANVKIQIVDVTGKIIANGQTDAQGNYTFKLAEALSAGSKLLVTATDNAGNSAKSEVSGTKDLTAPDAPNAQLNADGTILTGKTESKAKVSLFDADGNLLGTVTANTDGIYSIKVSPALTSDKGGTVIAEDAFGNKSNPSKVFAGKDTLAPDQPLIEVSKEGNSIHGRAEANAKVNIKDADGKIIGTGVTDAQGKFEITISPALTTGQKGSIIIEDAAGNQSKPLEINAGKDTIAPDKATAQLNAAGDSITGTAEANAKIQIKDSAGKLIGSGTADAQGKFTITISPELTEKKTAKIYVTDAAGNSSDATEIVGTKDITAPNKPLLQTVTDDVGAVKGTISAGGSTDDFKPSLSGSGEAKAILTIYDNGIPIGTVIVADNGKWSFNIVNDLSLGLHKITLTQTDAAGNTSELSDPFIFTVVAPTVSSMLNADETSSNAIEMLLSDHVGLNGIELNIESDPQPTVLENISIHDLLSSSNDSSNEIDTLLSQFSPNNSIESEGSVKSNSSGFDGSLSVKSDLIEQMDILQHAIV
ncbi:Ig-like repeat protein Blp2 [Acinetobacter beijerinckii]|uniref:Ig-like repeat protein Blp2 n=1 Tax=Acinetobacter beijerinckii TaxID=262668 RepID=UPI003AF9414C